MKRAVLILILSVILTNDAPARCLFNSVCPQQGGLGNTCLGRDINATVMRTNPALMHFAAGTSVAFDYQILYGLPELDQANLSLAHDFGFMHTGFAYSNFGQPDIIVENRVSIAFSRELLKYLSLAVRWDHYRMSFGGDFNDLSMNSLSLGIAAYSDNLVFHSAFSNITRPRLVESEEKAELEYRFGLCLRNLEYLVLNLELSGAGDIRRYHFGQEIMLEEIFFIRLGLITNPTMPSGGFGIKWNQFQLDYAINRHSNLGETHSFGFAVNL